MVVVVMLVLIVVVMVMVLVLRHPLYHSYNKGHDSLAALDVLEVSAY